MPLDAVRGLVGCEEEGVLAAPAETADADFEGGGLEGWGRGAEVLEEFEDSGTADWEGFVSMVSLFDHVRVGD